MTRSVAFALCTLALAACGKHQEPYSSRVGILQPTSTLTVTVKNAALNVYKPAVGEPSGQYTIAATQLPNTEAPPAPTVLSAGNGIVVQAPDPLYGLLVRLPDKVNLVVQSSSGNVSVIDVTGNVIVHAGEGKVKVLVPGYAEASNSKGDIEVTVGASAWPGTLKFTSDDGDVTVYVPEIAKFHAHLHTDNGTLFTDFNLTGTSSGSNETIDSPVNGGGAMEIFISTKHGAARLLRLAPQA
jgi:hypothetical protein